MYRSLTDPVEMLSPYISTFLLYIRRTKVEPNELYWFQSISRDEVYRLNIETTDVPTGFDKSLQILQIVLPLNIKF